MATNHSFDIVSRVELPELQNALNQSRKEIDNRFDFKGTGSRIEGGEGRVTVYSSDEFHLRSLIEVLEKKMAKRNVPLQAISWDKIEDGPKGTVRREAEVLQGIDKEKAKEIAKFVKKVDKKINVAIQEDQVRVVSKSKDSLQDALKAVKEKDFGIPLQFTNYR